LRTSRWDLPQNEQDRLTWCSFFTAASRFTDPGQPGAY
jgi:hypothetical protein